MSVVPFLFFLLASLVHAGKQTKEMVLVDSRQISRSECDDGFHCFRVAVVEHGFCVGEGLELDLAQLRRLERGVARFAVGVGEVCHC